MRLRGYSGRLRATLPRSSSPVGDAVLLTSAAGLFAVALVFRLAGSGLTPYSWLLPAAALLVLLAAVAWRLTRR